MQVMTLRNRMKRTGEMQLYRNHKKRFKKMGDTSMSKIKIFLKNATFRRQRTYQIKEQDRHGVMQLCKNLTKIVTEA